MTTAPIGFGRAFLLGLGVAVDLSGTVTGAAFTVHLPENHFFHDFSMVGVDIASATAKFAQEISGPVDSHGGEQLELGLSHGAPASR